MINHPIGGMIANGPHVLARNRPLLNLPIPQATQPSPIGTSTDNSSVIYATPNETMDEGGMFEVNQNVLGDAQLGGTPTPLLKHITSGRSSVSSVSGAPSPAIHGKDMERMKQLAKEEREEAKRVKAAAKSKQPAKAEKRKAATSSRETTSLGPVLRKIFVF